MEAPARSAIETICEFWIEADAAAEEYRYAADIRMFSIFRETSEDLLFEVFGENIHCLLLP